MASLTQFEAEVVGWEGSLRRKQCSWQVPRLTCQHSLHGEQWNGSAEPTRVGAKESTPTASPLRCRSHIPESKGFPTKMPAQILDLPPNTQSHCSKNIPTPDAPTHASAQEADTRLLSKTHTPHDSSIWHFMATVIRVVLLLQSWWNSVLGCVSSSSPDGTGAEVRAPTVAECFPNQSFKNA